MPIKSKPSDVFTAVKASTVCCAAGSPDLLKVVGSQCFPQKSIKNSLQRQTAASLAFSFSLKGKLIFYCMSAICLAHGTPFCRYRLSRKICFVANANPVEELCDTFVLLVSFCLNQVYKRPFLNQINRFILDWRR